MNEDSSAHENDCESGEESQRTESHGSNESSNNHKNPYYDRFLAWIHPYLPPPVNDNSETGKRRKHFQEHQKLFLEVAGFLFAGIGFIIVISQLGVLIWQLVEMNRQSKAMQGQLDEMHQATVLDERAWVYAEDPDNNLTLQGTNLVFLVTFKNTGKTSAFLTGYVAKAVLSTNQIPHIDDLVQGMGAVLVPSGTAQPPLSLPSAVIPYTGVNPVYIYGTIWYEDITGEKHWTQFCYMISRGGTITTLTFLHGLTDDMEKIEKANGN